MLIASWNINCAFSPRHEPIERIGEVFEERPDIVTLMEVHRSHADEVRSALGALGLEHSVYSRVESSKKSHGIVIASRWEVEEADRGWTTRSSRPEFAADAVVHVGEGAQSQAVEVVAAHIPNGSNNGWIKIECFEALAHRLRAAPDAPRILTGDFNEPQEIRPSGQIVTWGQVLLDDGGVHNDGERKSGKGERRGTDKRSRWDNGVRSVLAGESSHGLRNAWLSSQRDAASPVTWQKLGGSGSGFYDHIFVSRHFDIEGAGFAHEWRENGVSDHSVAWVDVGVAGAG